MSDFRDQLKIEGVNARGYGILPKMVMLDRKLTIEAKAIYSYFCSYAGAGSQAFPSTKKIQEDLDISKSRYYKHFNLLKDLGYIKVEQVRHKGGKFKHNIYTLVTNPEPILEEGQAVDNSEKNNELEPLKPSTQNEDSAKNKLESASSPCTQNRDTENRDTENKDTNINTLYKNNNSLYNQSFSLSKKNERENERMNENIDIENQLNDILEQAYVNEYYLKENYTAVKRAIESLYYRNKPLELNDMTIPVEQIREDLKELNGFHVEMGLRIFHERSAQQIIRNKIGYLAVCIYNAIFDMELKIRNDLRYDGII